MIDEKTRMIIAKELELISNKHDELLYGLMADGKLSYDEDPATKEYQNDFVTQEQKERYGITSTQCQFGIRKDGTYGPLDRSVTYKDNTIERVVEGELFSFEKSESALRKHFAKVKAVEEAEKNTKTILNK